MRVLLHTCCGPCASACVPRLKAGGCEVAMFYSNSNLDTIEEFEKRREAAAKLSLADGVELIVDDYDHDSWLKTVAAGLENEPEKGARCAKCFRFSLARAAAYAAAHGYDGFASSLTVSPHKISAVVFGAGEAAAETIRQTHPDGEAPEFLRYDFKKGEGFKLSVRRARELGLYRQGYCGCEFSKRKGTEVC